MNKFEERFRDNVDSFRALDWPKASGKCPFHEDSNPSFFMNVQAGSWKCHVCGRGTFKDFERRLQEQLLAVFRHVAGRSGDSAAPLESYSGGGKIRPIRMKKLISLVHESGEDIDEWFVEKLIAAESVGMAVGAPKAGKTTFVAQMIAALSCGDNFLGLKTKRIKVLILGLEERRRDVAKRFEQIGTTRGIRYMGGPFRATPAAYVALAEYVKRSGVRLIVIDTLANFWNVDDENSAPETERALEPIRQLARTLKIAVLLIHHSRKGEIAAGESIRGSSAIFAVVDAAFVFKSGKSFEDTQRILQVQSRLSGHFQMKLDYRGGRYRVIGKNDLNQDESSILKALTSERMLPAEEVCAKLGIKGTTARRACENLARKLPLKILVTGAGKKGDPKRYGLRGGRNGR